MPRLAVLGQPVAHSRSPAMQNAALEELGLAPEWAYEAIEVSPNDFEDRVRAMPGEGFAGANVTIPHKLAALAVADEASEAAKEIGAANTLAFTEGRIAAENTDATGILDALAPCMEPVHIRRREKGEPRGDGGAAGWLAGTRALVLGAGGSARAAVWALKQGGAEVSIWNRTAEKAAALARELNALSVALNDSENLPLEDFNIVLDLVYGAAETQLAAAARSRGARVVDGLEILVHQGAASLRLWTGLEPPVETMRRAARDIEWPSKTAPDT